MLEITWLGHGTFQFRLASGEVIVADPWTDGNPSYPPDHSFDRVLSSFLLHHLTKENKLKTLTEILRVLKPGGEFHLADWGKAQNMIMRLAFLDIQLLDGFETTSENVQGLLTRYLEDAGFESVEETKRYTTVFGTLSLYKALKREK